MGSRTVKTRYGEKTLVCLIPKPKGESGIISHEKTLCDCEVIELLEGRDKTIQTQQKIIEKQEEIIRFCKSYIRNTSGNNAAALSCVDNDFEEIQELKKEMREYDSTM